MTGRDLAERRGMETNVYQPAEDSALLAEAVVDHARGRFLEVGTGSGWVAEQAARKADVDCVVASDVNPHACESARKRGEKLRAEGHLGIEAVRANLVDPFRDGSFDTVAFNPPYLPTDPDNEWDDWMEHALSGGESGRKFLNPFVDEVGRVLTDGGRVLLLVSSLTGFDEVTERVESRGFDYETVVQESYPFETLSVLQLTK
ncbi:methyltransferase [Halogeometricum borinquense]|uniref:Methyltransferase n=1 Tax=Halogeometricum borinquense TaxID=60847 RepID=A0A6C0UJW4_9EURY|nr:HemK2/MTQ2 family protein methyltransferase [Halogeometricum borinquense]QIB74883.1 methyltransferase [Halogeometricum borinquense]QIQ76118.1 methyltransferase [Halogeometricum borinquense]